MTQEDRIILALADGACTLATLVSRMGNTADGRVVQKELHRMHARKLSDCASVAKKVHYFLRPLGDQRAMELGKKPMGNELLKSDPAPALPAAVEVEKAPLEVKQAEAGNALCCVDLGWGQLTFDPANPTETAALDGRPVNDHVYPNWEEKMRDSAIQLTKGKDGYQVRPYVPAKPRLTVKETGGFIYICQSVPSNEDQEQNQQVMIERGDVDALCEALLIAAGKKEWK